MNTSSKTKLRNNEGFLFKWNYISASYMETSTPNIEAALHIRMIYCWEHHKYAIYARQDRLKATWVGT